jgi:hypothetical protein
MRTNDSTCLPWQMKIPLQAPSLETAYAIAVAADRVREAAAGYRLYWMTAGGHFGSFDVPVDPQAFVVLGRHAMCDVVLEGDPTIALRHLLVRASRLDDGCPRLSVVDLHTNIAFELASGRSERSIAATGPIAFRVGAYAIIALPGGEPIPPALPAPECSRAIVPHPYRDAPVSSITLLPRAIQLGESVMQNTGPSWTLTVNGARGAASIQLSRLDLELGVLVGRAPKCNDMLRNVLNEGISRVHLMLRKGIAYDVASTQGTYAFHRRVRAVRLDDEGTDIRLGTVNPVFLRWELDRSSFAPPRPRS